MRTLVILACAILSSAAGVSQAAPPTNTPQKRPSRPTARVWAQYEATIKLEQQTLKRTLALLHKKQEVRTAERKSRLRALYKLSRANWPRLWFEPQARRNRVSWLAAARRIAMREGREVEMLRHEIDLADRAARRLEEESKRTPATMPKPKSLAWPVKASRIVQPYGIYRGPSYHVKLKRRGVFIEAKVRQKVSPVSPGIVRYRGLIRGLGTSLIIDHGNMTSILGNLDTVHVKVGDQVRTDTLLATASGPSLYLEIRVKVGTLGLSVDPAPLL